MRQEVEIENIEEMRCQAGIDDLELHEAIRALDIGDTVHLTLVSPTNARETVEVCITSKKGTILHGKLMRKPALAGLSRLRAGSEISFTTTHIHSIARRE